jgi:hypothetical protein
VSWLTFAAGLLRAAMTSSNEPPAPAREAPPPATMSEMSELLNRHRAEIDKNFQAVAAMLNAQQEQQLKALQAQRRWNYGLAAAVTVIAVLEILSFFRG